MAKLRDCLPRLMVTIRSLLFWCLVYFYCGLCASIYLLKLLWSICKGPTQTFRRVAREHPPACLNDPSLGTHCYVRIKVKAGAGPALSRGNVTAVRAEADLCMTPSPACPSVLAASRARCRDGEDARGLLEGRGATGEGQGVVCVVMVLACVCVRV